MGVIARGGSEARPQLPRAVRRSDGAGVRIGSQIYGLEAEGRGTCFRRSSPMGRRVARRGTPTTCQLPSSAAAGLAGATTQYIHFGMEVQSARLWRARLSTPWWSSWVGKRVG